MSDFAAGVVPPAWKPFSHRLHRMSNLPVRSMRTCQRFEHKALTMVRPALRKRPVARGGSRSGRAIVKGQGQAGMVLRALDKTPQHHAQQGRFVSFAAMQLSMIQPSLGVHPHTSCQDTRCLETSIPCARCGTQKHSVENKWVRVFRVSRAKAPPFISLQNIRIVAQNRFKSKQGLAFWKTSF